MLDAENDDLPLVRQCQQGDRNAFGSLVDRYQQAMFNVALRMVGDQDEAAEITQVAFVRAWEHIGSFDAKFRFFSWLYRIMVNAALDHLKHTRRMEQLSDAFVSEEEPADEVIDAEQTRMMMQREILALPPDYRIVIVLRHLQELSYDEIGLILKITPKLVKSRLFTARMMLRDRIVKRGYRSDA